MEQIHLKKSLKSISKIEPFYTGGPVLLTVDEKSLLCICSDEVKLVDLASGRVVMSFPGVCVLVSNFAALI